MSDMENKHERVRICRPDSVAPLVSLTRERVRETWASWSEKKLAQAGQEAGLEAGFLTQEGEFSQFFLFSFLVFFCFFPSSNF